MTERTREGADEHIDSLSMKYLGTKYPYQQPDETRVIFRIEPEHITKMS